MDNETAGAIHMLEAGVGSMEHQLGKPTDTAAQMTHQSVAAGHNPAFGKRAIPWGQECANLGIINTLLWIEGQIGLSPESLVPCMKFESNLNAQAKNPHSTATGFIQFMDATAKRLGTTCDALMHMTPSQQMSFVYKYFADYHRRGYDLHSWSVSDCYGAILWPAMIGKPDEYRVFVNDPLQPRDAYDVNKGLDFDHNGFITKHEACKRVNELYDEGLLSAHVAYV